MLVQAYLAVLQDLDSIVKPGVSFEIRQRFAELHNLLDILSVRAGTRRKEAGDLLKPASEAMIVELEYSAGSLASLNPRTHSVQVLGQLELAGMHLTPAIRLCGEKDRSGVGETTTHYSLLDLYPAASQHLLKISQDRVKSREVRVWPMVGSASSRGYPHHSKPVRTSGRRGQSQQLLQLSFEQRQDFLGGLERAYKRAVVRKQLVRTLSAETSGTGSITASQAMINDQTVEGKASGLLMVKRAGHGWIG